MVNQVKVGASLAALFLATIPGVGFSQDSLPEVSVYISDAVIADCVELNPDGELVFVPCPPPPPFSESGTEQVLVVDVEGDSEHGPLNINLKIGGTAENGTDYVDFYNDNAFLPEVLSVPEGSGRDSYYFGIQAVDDDLIEGDETITVTVLEGEGYEVTQGNWYQASATIVDNDTPPADFQINAGLNDAWFNPEVDDQGFIITVLPVSELMLISWFTYELSPREEQPDDESSIGDDKQRWLSAQGRYSGNAGELIVWNTSDGGFGEKKAGRKNVGHLNVTFNNCNDGDVTYLIKTQNGNLVSGTSHIERIVADNIPYCEELDEKARQGE